MFVYLSVARVALALDTIARVQFIDSYNPHVLVRFKDGTEEEYYSQSDAETLLTALQAAK